MDCPRCGLDERPIQSAIAAVIHWLLWLTAVGLVIVVIAGLVECSGRCGAWQADLIECESTECRRELAEQRPQFCTRPKQQWSGQ